MTYKLYNSGSPAAIERIIGALTYVNCLIGLVWLIIAALMKKGIRPFLKYHIYQSLFLAFLLFLVGAGLNLIMRIINFVLIVLDMTVKSAIWIHKIGIMFLFHYFFNF